jgi:hypothetical protein
MCTKLYHHQKNKETLGIKWEIVSRVDDQQEFFVKGLQMVEFCEYFKCPALLLNFFKYKPITVQVLLGENICHQADLNLMKDVHLEDRYMPSPEPGHHLLKQWGAEPGQDLLANLVCGAAPESSPSKKKTLLFMGPSSLT